MALASKDAIFGLRDTPPPVRFHVPEWGDDVFLRHPTANDRDEWELYCNENRGKRGTLWRAKLAAMILCDEDGKLLFTKSDDVERLGTKSASALHRIWERGLQLFAVSEREVDELEKN